MGALLVALAARDWVLHVRIKSLGYEKVRRGLLRQSPKPTTLLM